MKKEIVILTLWSEEKIEIENISYENFIKQMEEKKKAGSDWINISSLRRFLKFSAIADIKWKTNFIALESPKQEYKELTKQEREKRDDYIKKMLEDTFPRRKKNFILNTRVEILENLAKQERYFWLQTTKEKLQELEWCIKNNIKWEQKL